MCHGTPKCRPDLARHTFIILLCVAGVLLGGCSQNKPTMSGFALGDLRIVSVGDTITLRAPAAPNGGRQWRVSSFDSLFLTMARGPQLEVDKKGRAFIVTRAIARTAGETTVTLQEVASQAGRKPRVVEFDLRITE